LRFQPGGIAWTHTVRGRDIRPLSGAGPGHRAAAEFIGSADGTGAPRLGNTLPLGRAPLSLNSGAVAVGPWSVGEGDGVGWRRGTGGGRPEVGLGRLGAGGLGAGRRPEAQQALLHHADALGPAGHGA